MNRRLCAFGLILVLTACGGGSGNYIAERKLVNACIIADERPKYLKAMKRTERKWGVPVAVQMATIYQESKFQGDARTPLQYSLGVIPMGRQSSAYGYAQALDGTWDEYKQETGKRRAKRNDIDDATDFIGWYMDKTEARNGIPKTDASRQYLAYHEGHRGYARGSYKKKSWLMRVADDVGDRAITYDAQLRSCREI
ncbi:MAG: lytic transglycosylase [Pseudomonadota bacterium]